MKPVPARLANAVAAMLLASGLLAGCARDETDYPSLLPRAIEKRGFDEPTAAVPAPAVADPALEGQVTASRGKLDAVTHGFDADAARADKAAGAAGARTVGSEAWITAQTALAALDDRRAQTSEIATSVDALVRTRIETTGTPYPALEALRARTESEGARQSARIAAIGARLPTP